MRQDGRAEFISASSNPHISHTKETARKGCLRNGGDEHGGDEHGGDLPFALSDNVPDQSTARKQAKVCSGATEERSGFS